MRKATENDSSRHFFPPKDGEVKTFFISSSSDFITLSIFSTSPCSSPFVARVGVAKGRNARWLHSLPAGHWCPRISVTPDSQRPSRPSPSPGNLPLLLPRPHNLKRNTSRRCLKELYSEGFGEDKQKYTALEPNITTTEDPELAMGLPLISQPLQAFPGPLLSDQTLAASAAARGQSVLGFMKV